MLTRIKSEQITESNLVITVESLEANGSFGSNGQILTSNGTTVYWSTGATGSGDANAAYTNAVAYADSVANDAYTNAVAYADSVANDAYTNAVAYADSVANDAYTNAISYADSVANDAYTNAISYADSVANDAYTNAVAYADTIGTNTDAQYTWTNNHTFEAEITFNANLVANTLVANGSVGSNGQVLTTDGSIVYWANSGGGGASVTTSNTAPTSPSDGDLWWDSETGQLYVYYVDANTNQWVQATSTPLSEPLTGNSQTFTANGTQDTFALSGTVTGSESIIVSLNGLLQVPTTHYTVSGSNVTFTSIPTNNSIVEVRSMAGYISLIEANTLSVDSIITVGNSSVNTQITPGNVYLNGSTLVIGNTASNVTINSTSVTVGTTTLLGPNYKNSTAIIDTSSDIYCGNGESYVADVRDAFGIPVINIDLIDCSDPVGSYVTLTLDDLT